VADSPEYQAAVDVDPSTSLEYRSPVDVADPSAYAPWVRELRGRSGCYVIREADTGRVVYVGESHTHRLYSTLTRHFQGWNGYTAGTTYDRYAVEVALSMLDELPGDVVAQQVILILELEPADNTHHQASFDMGEIDPADFEDDW